MREHKTVMSNLQIISLQVVTKVLARSHEWGHHTPPHGTPAFPCHRCCAHRAGA